MARPLPRTVKPGVRPQIEHTRPRPWTVLAWRKHSTADDAHTAFLGPYTVLVVDAPAWADDPKLAVKWAVYKEGVSGPVNEGWTRTIIGGKCAAEQAVAYMIGWKAL